MLIGVRPDRDMFVDTIHSTALREVAYEIKKEYKSVLVKRLNEVDTSEIVNVEKEITEKYLGKLRELERIWDEAKLKHEGEHGK